MSMKSKLLLMAGMAEMFACMDRNFAMSEMRKEGKGGFREKSSRSKTPKTPKQSKSRKKNKAAKASRKKNRKH